jgi:hypothetical protein
LSFIQEYDEEGKLKNGRKINTWIERDAMAAGLIYGSLEPEYQTSVGGSVDAADMWKILNQEHAQVAAANSNQLTAKFFQYIMNPGNNNQKSTTMKYSF